MANKFIFDEDSAIDAKREDHQVRLYEKEERNRILSMVSTKKQSAWNKLFPKPTYSPEIESMVY